jgi:NAD(P)-dependent dehydrogenase (short-subunit alcohol dehydrogenase family)
VDFAGAVAVVTGGADGLGAAVCRRVADEGAAGVVVADIDREGAERVAAGVGGLAVEVDVSSEQGIIELVRQSEARFGQIDVVFSNAGIIRGAHPFAADETFDQLWRVHIMSIVYLARHTLPGMIARGKGGFVVTASTDGITTSTGDMAYAVTKHGQVAAAEWLSMAYGSRGISVSCFCPGWMWTGMTRPYQGAEDVPASIQMAMRRAVSAADAAAMLVEGVKKGQFLITTADDTMRDLRHKAADFDGWIAQLQAWHDTVQPDVGPES